MNSLRVAPIVEGNGEVECIRILIERIWIEMIGGAYVDVVKPTRVSRTKLAQRLKSGELHIDSDEVAEVVKKAWQKLLEKRNVDPVLPELVLILIDADEDCPGKLGPALLGVARETVGDQIDVACVIANVEYETWFVAAAESLRDTGFLTLAEDFQPVSDPEYRRAQKNGSRTDSRIPRNMTNPKINPE